MQKNIHGKSRSQAITGVNSCHENTKIITPMPLNPVKKAPAITPHSNEATMDSYVKGGVMWLCRHGTIRLLPGLQKSGGFRSDSGRLFCPDEIKGLSACNRNKLAILPNIDF